MTPEQRLPHYIRHWAECYDKRDDLTELQPIVDAVLAEKSAAAPHESTHGHYRLNPNGTLEVLVGDKYWPVQDISSTLTLSLATRIYAMNALLLDSRQLAQTVIDAPSNQVPEWLKALAKDYTCDLKKLLSP